MNTKITLALPLLLALLVGCEVPELDIPDNKPAPPNNQQAKAEQPVEKTAEQPIGAATGEPQVIADAAPREFTPKDSKKGKRSREVGGYLGAVGSARFTSENRMTINLYKHALNLYWAETGEYPKTHDEFMEKIINFNKIQLPELEEGVEYIYDPEDRLLKVHRPSADAEDVSRPAGTYIGDVATGKFFGEHREELEDLVKATESFKDEHGRNPKSNEEFMEKIIGDKIKLPELEPGMQYFYDPESESLKIYRIDN